MLKLLAQLKYDIQQIELKLKAIKKAEKEMLLLKGTPAQETRQSAINNWLKEIEDHKNLIDIYYLKFKSF